MISKALFSHLSNDPVVGPLVANGNAYRIFPHHIPQQAGGGLPRVPCIVYGIAGQVRTKTYCGTSRLIQSSISIDNYATTMAGAEDLSAAVRDSLIDFRGLMGNQLRVRDVSLEGSLSLDDMEPGLFRVSQTFEFWHVEE